MQSNNDADLSQPLETEKLRIPASRLNRDDIVSLAQVVEDASQKNSQFYGPGITGDFGPHFLFEGGKKDFACASVNTLKSGRWPSDTKRVSMTCSEPCYVNVVVDTAKVDDNVAVVRGSDPSWVKSSMRTIEDIFEETKTYWGLLLHRVTIWILSCFFAFVGVSFFLLKLLLADLAPLWSVPLYAFMFFIVILAIGNAMSGWVARTVRFLVPFADFAWNTSRSQKIARGALGLLIGGLVGGAVYEILRTILSK